MAAAVTKRDAFERDWRAYLKLRAAWRDDPVRYVRERLGMKPTWQQRKILEAIADPGAKVTVRSGHGIGKSGAASGAILWFLETRDHPKIPCTSPTSSQLKDVLWAEIAKWIRRADTISARRGDHPRLWLSRMFKVTNDRIYDPSAKGEWFAVARTSGKDNPDALQGFHASDLEVSEDGREAVQLGDSDGHIMFVVDEASGVFDEVFQVAEGALSSHGSRLLMLGNPTRNTGYFADSHKKNRGEFTALHFRSSDSPLVAPDYRDKLVRKWGEGSNIVRVRADGEFPRQDDDALIALEMAEQALDREPHRDAYADIRVGVDVARFGDDRTVYVVRQGADLLHIEVHAKEDTMTTAGRAKRLRKKYKARAIYPDVTGLGAGVADRLREVGEPVVEVNFAAKAPARRRGDDEAQGRKMRDYLWLEMADWVKNAEPSFHLVGRDLAEDLVGELVSVKYKIDSDGRVVVESKDDLKSPKRLGFSPDIADALACTFCPGDPGGGYAVAGGTVF